MSRLERQKPESVARIIKLFFKESGLSAAHNTQLVFEAWDKASQAVRYTQRRFYRDGILYITLNSSAARMHLQLQKASLLENINAILRQDPRFIEDETQAGYVKELRLK